MGSRVWLDHDDDPDDEIDSVGSKRPKIAKKVDFATLRVPLEGRNLLSSVLRPRKIADYLGE